MSAMPRAVHDGVPLCEFTANCQNILPTVAQSDYIQNGLNLPKVPKNLELLLRDFDAKSYLDIELVYRLRQKEPLGSVKQKIVIKLRENESAFCVEELGRETLEVD